MSRAERLTQELSRIAVEEKSLGCTQKGGTNPMVDVLDYGDVVRKKG
jgi:altronate dehydratase